MTNLDRIEELAAQTKTTVYIPLGWKYPVLLAKEGPVLAGFNLSPDIDCLEDQLLVFLGNELLPFGETHSERRKVVRLFCQLKKAGADFLPDISLDRRVEGLLEEANYLDARDDLDEIPYVGDVSGHTYLGTSRRSLPPFEYQRIFWESAGICLLVSPELTSDPERPIFEVQYLPRLKAFLKTYAPGEDFPLPENAPFQDLLWFRNLVKRLRELPVFQTPEAELLEKHRPEFPDLEVHERSEGGLLVYRSGWRFRVEVSRTLAGSRQLEMGLCGSAFYTRSTALPVQDLLIKMFPTLAAPQVEHPNLSRERVTHLAEASSWVSTEVYPGIPVLAPCDPIPPYDFKAPGSFVVDDRYQGPLRSYGFPMTTILKKLREMRSHADETLYKTVERGLAMHPLFSAVEIAEELGVPYIPPLAPESGTHTFMVGSTNGVEGIVFLVFQEHLRSGGWSGEITADFYRGGSVVRQVKLTPFRKTIRLLCLGLPRELQELPELAPFVNADKK